MFHNRRQSGYTLMEMVVAIAIFVIIATVITGVFIAILRVQRKTAAMQRTQQDARWAMETMARYARVNKIDYSPTGQPSVGFNGESELYLVDAEGNPIHFKKDGDILKMNDNDITPAKVKVEDLRFYISPDSTPYLPGGEDEQSRVTILFHTASAEGETRAEMKLQTTVSTRAYTR